MKFNNDSPLKPGELFSLVVKSTHPLALDDDRLYGEPITMATSTAGAMANGEDELQGRSFTYLTGGTTATTTFQFTTERATTIDENWFAVASSTSLKIHTCNEFSNNGVDWFAEVGQQTNSINEGIIGEPFCREWTAPVTATSTFNIAITPVASKYTRTNFRATGANGAVWIQAVIKEPVN